MEDEKRSRKQESVGKVPEVAPEVSGDERLTFDMALLRVGFGAEFLAPKRRFMMQGWHVETLA